MPRTPEQVIEDDELVDAVRAGRTAAYARLWLLHRDVALGVARRMVRGQADAEDVVSEAFARVLAQLRRGGGPDGPGFRAYLVTAVRNGVRDRARGETRVEPVADLELVAPARIVVPFDDRGVTGAVERALVVDALRRLPARWRTVLWHTEIDGRPPAEVARLFGMTPNGVAALAYRAREGLRRAYLQAHLDRRVVPATACGWVVDRLGVWARGGLGASAADRVRDHLAGCGGCRRLLADLADVTGRLVRAA
ncbi:sigma-70 family RNA polymerase sigma factor [Actinosynnema sp. NPDC059335]|uniref:sigma-70 family RNA polymerase sigma factor n=1 Tax=Actinosynnema sp. NPDC059335 TaxID=3346804 RepID=UPI003672179C